MNLEKCPLTEKERHDMIAEAAYLKSRQQNSPGDPEANWLSAETELNDALAADCRKKQEKQALPVYDRMRTDVRRVLEKAEETVNAEAIRKALAKVNADLRKAGDYLPDSIDRASKAVKQEIDEVISRLGHDWGNFRIKQREFLAVWKEKRTRPWSRTSRTLQQWLTRWRNRSDH